MSVHSAESVAIALTSHGYPCVVVSDLEIRLTEYVDTDLSGTVYVLLTNKQLSHIIATEDGLIYGPFCNTIEQLVENLEAIPFHP